MSFGWGRWMVSVLTSVFVVLDVVPAEQTRLAVGGEKGGKMG